MTLLTSKKFVVRLVFSLIALTLALAVLVARFCVDDGRRLCG